MKKFLEVGKIVNTHGLKGELKVSIWCDDIKFFSSFNTFYLDNKGKENLVVKSIKQSKNVAIVDFESIDSIEKAQIFINKIIYINRDDAKIEKGAYFIQDLIGTKVIDIDTLKEYGSISDVLKTGANDVFEVKTVNKKYLIPVIDDVVKDINLEDNIIRISPLEGLFDDEV